MQHDCVWRGVIPIWDVLCNAHQHELHHRGQRGHVITRSPGRTGEMSVHLLIGDSALTLQTFTRSQYRCYLVRYKCDTVDCSEQRRWKRLRQQRTHASRLAAGRLLLYDPLRCFAVLCFTCQSSYELSAQLLTDVELCWLRCLTRLTRSDAGLRAYNACGASCTVWHSLISADGMTHGF